MAVNGDSVAAVRREPPANGDSHDTEKLLERQGGAGHPRDAAPESAPPSPGPPPEAAAPRGPSPSRAGPPSSTAGAAPPPSYLWMAVLSCLCPGVPLNVCALWYASVSRSVLNDGDVEAARKYGRASLLLSCLAMLLGAAVIVFLVFTVEFQQ